MEELKLEILSSFEEKKAICYLCKASLDDYVKSIPDKYEGYISEGNDDYNNFYLNKFIESLLNNKYIPSIVLNSKGTSYSIDKEKKNITLKKYNILDGSRRTNKINMISRAFEFYLKKYNDNEELDKYTNFALKRKYKTEIEKNKIDIEYLYNVIKFYRNNKLDKDTFKKHQQIFEVWINLEDSEVVDKMLVFNVGHKTTKLKNQMELLFLNVLSETKLSKFVSTKEIKASSFVDNKEVGKLHLVHFVFALLTFDKAEPILRNRKHLYITQENDGEKLEKIKKFFQADYLHSFVNFAEKLDKIYYQEYGLYGVKWIEEDAIMIGTYAAFGKYFKKRYDSDLKVLEKCFDKILETIKKNIRKIRVKEFENEAKKTDVTIENVDNLYKYASYFFYYKMLEDEKPPNWNKIFNRLKNIF